MNEVLKEGYNFNRDKKIKWIRVRIKRGGQKRKIYEEGCLLQVAKKTAPETKNLEWQKRKPLSRRDKISKINSDQFWKSMNARTGDL